MGKSPECSMQMEGFGTKNQITSWYSETGEFPTTFPSGPGKCEGDTREWKRSSTPLTPEQITEYSRGIFC